MTGQSYARPGPGRIIGLILIFVFILVPVLSAERTVPLPEGNFPVFPSIRPNVNFWKKVFTQYDGTQGLIHDTRHLDRIYEVIHLVPENNAAGARKNEAIKADALKKYKSVLLHLAKGNSPTGILEKRVAGLLGPGAGPREFKRAAHRLRCQTGIKEKFRAGLIRSGAFIDEFKIIFLSHGLPSDLVYLACVESSFDIRAYSKFGAAGIWQFTRETGRLFMQIDYVVDQRRDPFVATDAAARLLKKNHALLGDWPLALTAYNHGLAGMARAKKAKGSYENIFNSYTGRTFRFASRNFYPEFLAARDAAKNYKTYFGDLDFARPIKMTEFKTQGYLPARELADAVGLTMSEIQTMNPALRPPVFKGQKHIPSGFKLRLPGHIPSETIHRAVCARYQDRQKPSRFHRVQKGDTAGAIARIHGVSLHDLILANRLDAKAVICVGQNLRIPVTGEVLPAQTPDKTAEARADRLAEQDAGKVKESPLNPVQENALSRDVAPGNGAGQIQARPSIVAARAAINPEILTERLKIQEIVLQEGQTIGVIQVAPEETLGHYADWLKIPTTRLRSLNRIRPGTKISIDQVIKIPIPPSGQERFEELRYEFHKEMEEDFFESFSVLDVKTYEIRNGDTIWELCLNQLEIPLWLLKKYNPDTNVNTLRSGQQILYPLVNRKSDPVSIDRDAFSGPGTDHRSVPKGKPPFSG